MKQALVGCAALALCAAPWGRASASQEREVIEHEVVERQVVEHEIAEPVEDHTPEVRETEARETEARETGAHETETRETETGTTQDITAADLLGDIGREEGPERDEHGYAVRRGEVSAMDMAPSALAALETAGFHVIAHQQLAVLGHDVVRLSTPATMSARDARAAVQAADPAATVDVVHYYGLGLAAGAKPHKVRGDKAQSSYARPQTAGALTIGMIDTGVSLHPALGNARLVSWAQGQQPGSPLGHGTAVASIIAAHGPATIYTANIFRGPAARPFTTADVVVDALEWMLAQGVPIINMSLAGPRNAVLDKLIGEAIAKGHMVVAAAGNGGPAAPPAYPGALPGVIAVTAVDKDMRIYRYANHGPYIAVAARGVDVVAANAPGGLARFTGTSFATAHVAAMLAFCRTGGGSARSCRDALLRSARDLGPAGFDETYGYGFVD